VSPNLIILGGGISKYWSKFEKYLESDVEIIPAELQNHAGIIGAAAEVNS